MTTPAEKCPHCQEPYSCNGFYACCTEKVKGTDTLRSLACERIEQLTAELAKAREEQVALMRTYDPNCDVYVHDDQLAAMRSARQTVEAMQELATYLGRDPEGCLTDIADEVMGKIDDIEVQLAEAQRALAQREGELAMLREIFVGLEVTERGTRKECSEFVREELRKTLDALPWLMEDTANYISDEQVNEAMLAVNLEQLTAERTAHEATRAELHELLTAAQAREAKLREANAKLFAACEWVLTSDAGYELVSCALDLPEGVWIESGGDSIEVAAALSPPDRREQNAARVPSGEELEGGARPLEILE